MVFIKFKAKIFISPVGMELRNTIFFLFLTSMLKIDLLSVIPRVRGGGKKTEM